MPTLHEFDDEAAIRLVYARYCDLIDQKDFARLD